MSDTKLACFLLLVFPLLASCTGIPDGVEPVTGFQLERYLGTWYEIARLDHRFERGLSEVTANYSLKEDGGVRVVNRGYDTESGEWNESVGKAYLIDEPGTGRLKVSFFGPFYGAYNIIELDKENYRYSMVAGPDRSYLWILARTPHLNDAITERLLGKAKRLGFPTEALIFPEHSMTGRD